MIDPERQRVALARARAKLAEAAELDRQADAARAQARSIARAWELPAETLDNRDHPRLD